jgi:hypothetical protein
MHDANIKKIYVKKSIREYNSVIFDRTHCNTNTNNK